MEDLSKLIYQYKLAFRKTNFNNCRLMVDVAGNMYDALIQQYDYYQELGDIKHQCRICQLIDEEILGKLVEAVSQAKTTKIANEAFELHRKFFALSARRNLKNFALYIEQYKKKKVWSKTIETMKAAFYYADEFSVSENLNLLRMSCMPGLGKSYWGNLYIAQSVGNDPNLSVLRITYSDDLVKITTKQTKAIIDSQAYREIFPRYLGVERIFKADDNYSFCLCDCEDEFNLFGVTRDGQATGKRAKLVVIDDLLKGESESNNVTLHQQMVNRYDSDWSSRADDDNQKLILLGTMWAPTDLLNVLLDRACEDDTLVDDKKFEYVQIAKDGEAVFIGIPALDKNDQSTCPLRFSTAKLLKKRSKMARYLWMAVYQQDPIAPEGLEFNDSVLSHYDTLPDGATPDCKYAALDPARKGKNFVSMPITYKYDGVHYLVDFLYQKKSMAELYDAIVDKIIIHRLNWLVVENNTDTSLKMVLEQKLKERGYYGCTIIEKYSTQNKEMRIKDNQGYVRNDVLFPKKGSYSPLSDLGKAIEAINSYSFSYPNKFDDAIDSIVLLVMEFIAKKSKVAKVKIFNRRALGF